MKRVNKTTKTEVTAEAPPSKAHTLRALFLAAAKEDPPAGVDIRRMASFAKGRKTVKLVEGNLHGTKMFGMLPIDLYLSEFLNSTLK